MTIRNSITVPVKDVRYCPTTRDYEILVNSQIIGYAPTKLRGYELANEYVYLLLTRDHLDPAELSQEDADAILAAQLSDMPLQLELAAQAELEFLEAQSGIEETWRPLPTTHPILQLVREAAWLLAAPRIAA